MQPQLVEDLRAQRIVDAGDDLRDPKDLVRDLARRDVTVIARRAGHEGVGVLDARAELHVHINARAEHGPPVEFWRQAVEGVGVRVDHRDVVPLRRQVGRQERSHAPAPHDDNVHHLPLPVVSGIPVSLTRRSIR